MLTLLWLDGLVRHRTVRVLGVAACVALSIAIVASLGAFISASNARMTSLALAGIPVDWQVELAPGTNLAAAHKTVSGASGVQRAIDVGYGQVAAFTATTGVTVQTTGEGRALGLPNGYDQAFPGEIRYLSGARSGVLLGQQTASNLHVAPGGTVSIELPGGGLHEVRVDGVIDLPQADSLFQIVGAPPGAGATAPPDNVILLPLDQWRALFNPIAKTNPEAVRDQIHIELLHNLPTSPEAAYTEVVARAHNLEAKLAGSARVGNNVAAILDSARADAVYSELLFLFLGLPGVVLAWLLAMVAGASGRDRRRREQGLLRLRGASPHHVLWLGVAEAILVGVIGVLLGLTIAVSAGELAFETSPAALLHGTPLTWAIIAVALGFVLAGAAIVVPAWRDTRSLTVIESRTPLSALKRPLWERLYLDLILLAGAGLIFYQSMSNAYQVILVPEGVPTISINYLTLLAPMMFWIGFALLAWRLADVTLRRGRVLVTGAVRPLAGKLAGTVRASMARQSQLLSRGLVLVALAVSFAVSVAIFNTTYTNQARVDAQLTNGADVAVIAGESGLPADMRTHVLGLPGVTDAEPMQHRFAYVGNDLQDLYGIDPTTIGRATPMSDAFFQDGTAAQVLGKLAATPDGILVSDETVSDFELQPGDTVRIRLQGPDHMYHVVPFHYVGVAREFPTAPHDSFLVANASYVAKATGVAVYETLLIKTSESPKAVAGSVRSLVGPASGVTVNDLETELRTTLSSLTSIDLTGLTRLELGFAVIMAVAASGLMLMLGFAERRRVFAIAHALGAKGSQLASFVWSEALFTALGGVALGALAGWLEAWMIVKILTGVFDPPPDSLSVPWTYLGLVGAVIAASVVIAVALAVRAARRPSLQILRDL